MKTVIDLHLVTELFTTRLHNFITDSTILCNEGGGRGLTQVMCNFVGPISCQNVIDLIYNKTFEAKLNYCEIYQVGYGRIFLDTRISESLEIRLCSFDRTEKIVNFPGSKVKFPGKEA